MALASEEGLKGFAEDLDLVYASSGRTDEALSKMIRTQQREAEVVKQSQEVIQRSIGETWSPIKRNMQATKLWFATFLAGGFSIEKANDAIKDLGETLDENRQKIYDSISAMGQMGQQPIFTQLFNMENYDAGKIKEVIKKSVDMDDIKDFLSAQSLTMPKPEFGDTDVTTWANDMVTTLKSAMESPAVREKNIFGSLSESWTKGSKEWTQGQVDAITEALDIPPIKIEGDVGDAKDAINDLGDTVDDFGAGLVNSMSDNVDAFNEFWSAIDTAREQVFNFKTNILELQNAIAGLSTEVSDIFTDLSGQEHAGTLGMAIDIKSFDTASDRMGRFSTMIKEYGVDWENMFYEVFEGKTYSVGNEEISYIDEYDTNLKDAVNTVYGFKAAQEEVKKVMSEVNKIIQLNNIAIAELQLKGMMRRRGQTRQEQRTIKKLQIENMKERLKEKKAEHEAMKDIDKQAYNEANAEIKEYFDTQKFNLFLMKDAREDELDHMVDTFESKEKLLKHYKDALITQEGHLKKAHEIEIDLLTWIKDEYPDIADLYEDVYGVSIPESIRKSTDAMQEWIDLQKGGQQTTEGGWMSIKDKLNLRLGASPEFQDMKSRMHPGMVDVLHERGLPGFSRGIDYMPRTEPALIHQGERIVPSGKDIGGNTIIQSVTIQVKEIADIGSVEKVGAILGAVRQTNISDRQGRTKYRL